MLALFVASCFCAGTIDYEVCIYKIDESECPFNETSSTQLMFSLDNFNDFHNYQFVDARRLTVDLTCSLPIDCQVELSRFQDLYMLRFDGTEASNGKASIYLKTVNNFNPILSISEVDFTIERIVNFTKLSLSESVMTLTESTTVSCGTLVAEDLLSIAQIECLVFTRKFDTYLMNFAEGRRTLILDGNGTIDLRGSLTTPVEMDIVNQRMIFRTGNGTKMHALDMTMYTGKTMNINNGFSMLSRIRCLSYSHIFPLPHIVLKHTGFLEMSASNWPDYLGVIMTIQRTGFVTLHVGGTLPADIIGTGDLTIVPSTDDTRILGKVEMNDNTTLKTTGLTYFNPVSLTLGKLNVNGSLTVIGWPALLTTTIESFGEDEGHYNFSGTAFFAFRNSPRPPSTMIVEAMWGDAPIMMPVEIDESVNFSIVNKVKIPEPPLMFMPVIDEIPPVEVIKRNNGTKLPFICSDLLKCEKIGVTYPDLDIYGDGAKGFTLGTHVFERYCEKEGGITCAGVAVKNDINQLYNSFCVADSEINCPEGSKFITDDSWTKFIQDDASVIGFVVMKSIKLDFSKFKQDLTVVIHAEPQTPVEINMMNVKRLLLAGAKATLTGTARNSSVELYAKAQLSGDFDFSSLNVLVDSMETFISLPAVNQITVMVNAPRVISIGKKQVTIDGVTMHASSVNITAGSYELDESLNITSSSDADTAVDIWFTAGNPVNLYVLGSFAADASALWRIHGFHGTLWTEKETCPISFLDTVSLTCVNKLTSTADRFDIAGSVEFQQPATFKNLVIQNLEQFTATSLTTDTLTISGVSLYIAVEPITVKKLLKLMPNSGCDLSNVNLGKDTPIEIHYRLNAMPLMAVQPTEEWSPNIELVYDDGYWTKTIKDESSYSSLTYGNLSILGGEKFVCDESKVTFRSNIMEFDGEYSILVPVCQDNILMLLSNSTAPAPPTASPMPPLPTATVPPDSTKRNVIIITVTVFVAFAVIIVITIKVMNKKKAYENKKKDEQERIREQNASLLDSAPSPI